MKKRVLTILLACLLTLGLLPLSVSAAGELAFTDVVKTDWFYNDVKTAVDAGLVNGKSATTYCPADNLTYAEAVKLAACMNQKHSTGIVSLVNGDPWYQSYVDYAKMQGIITKDYEWKQPATRAGYMAIFAHALPDSALAAKNEVPDGSIPDVPMTHPQAAEIYKLYRAGILQGSDAKFSCNPESNIRRSEVAAILTRMMFVNERKSFTTVTKTETPKTEELKIMKQPASYAMKAAEEKVPFTVEISGGKAPYTYQWYVEKETGTSLTPAPSEKTTSSVTVPVNKDSFTTTKYIRVYVAVTDAEGKTVTSEKAEITAFKEDVPALKITKQPQNAEGKKGDWVQFSITVSGGKAPYTYEWQYWEDWADDWSDISNYGTTAADGTLSIQVGSVPEYGLADFIRCVVTDAAGKKIISDSVHYTVTADKLVITKQPVSLELPADHLGYPLFTLEISGGKVPYTYKWSYMLDDSFEDVTTQDKQYATESIYMPSAFEYSDFDHANRIHVKCTVTDSSGQSVTSNEVEITIPKNHGYSALNFTMQPGDVTVELGGNAVFSVAVNYGVEPYSYEWHKIRPDGVDIGVPPGSAYEGIYTAKVTVKNCNMTSDNGAKMYCVVKDATGKTVTSATGLITVTNSLKIEQDIVHYGMVSLTDTPSYTVKISGGVAPYTYDWYYLFDGYLFPIVTKYGPTSETSSTFVIESAPEDKFAKNLVPYVYCLITDDAGSIVTTSKLYVD